MEKYNTRDDVPLKYKWDLSIWYKDNDEFKKVLKKCDKEIDKIKSYVGCTKDSKKLKEYLDFDVELGSEIMNLEIYAMTYGDSDLELSEGVEFQGLTDNLYTKYKMESSFFEPELLNMKEDEYKTLFKDNTLDKYKAYLDNLYRYNNHHLSESEQRIESSLSSTLNTYGNISSTLLNSNHDYGKVKLENGEEEVLTITNYRRIMKSLPRDKRKETYLQLQSVISQYASTNAALLNNYVKTRNAQANIYKFDSAWDWKQFDNKLSDKVFDALVSACVENKDILKKYYKIKEKVLGVDKLMPWDSILDLYEYKKEYSIEEAQDICLKALSVLGDDYLDRFKLLIDNRCVYYCQYKGKCSGGYNVSGIGNKLSNILMSFNYNLDSVSTLIHEGGHFTHHTYMYDNNDAIYREHSSIICEVASLTNECLLSNYLVKNGSKEEGLAGLANMICVILSNLFDAVQEGDMEREFYKYSLEGGTLTKDYMNNLAEESLLKFYPIDKLKHEYQKNFWVTRSHYYMMFYLFSYSICVSVASNLAQEILNGNEDMIAKYKKFLSCGSDMDIMDVFKVIDIDLEDKNVYVSAIKYFDSLLDQFDKLYKEVN